MRILLHDYGGYAFIAQLSRELARRGHQLLHVYSGYNNTPKGTMSRPPELGNRLTYKPIYTRQPFQKYSFIRRWLQEREYGTHLSREVEDYRPDVVISAQTPLDSQVKFKAASRAHGAHFVFWVQDLIGVATRRILRKRIPVVGDLIGRYYIWLERRLIRDSDQVVVIAEDFEEKLRSWGVEADKIEVIPNWAPIDEIPVKPKRNTWAKRQGLADRFVFLYTGTLALKHDPELLEELARTYEERSDVRIVVVSEGPGAEWLRSQAKVGSLKNVQVLDYQRGADYPMVLGTGDVLLAVLTQDAGIFSVPSKVLAYCCAARPILAAIPEGNAAAKIIEDVGAGLVSNPDDEGSFVTNAERLRNDPELRAGMARRGRKFAERAFDLESIADRFERLFR